MRTFEIKATVAPGGELRVVARVPPDIPPGDHNAVLVLDEAQNVKNPRTAAAEAVRPGGVLVYAVCTFSDAETVGVDAWAARELTDFRPVDPPAPPWRPHGRGALLLPSDADTDGMFVSVLEKK